MGDVTSGDEASGDDASGDETRVDAVMLEVMVNATLNGHNLGPWVADENDLGAVTGWQALCRQCARSVWVGRSGVLYTLLADRCPKREPQT